jgi:hypothetical protein
MSSCQLFRHFLHTPFLVNYEMCFMLKCPWCNLVRVSTITHTYYIQSLQCRGSHDYISEGFYWKTMPMQSVYFQQNFATFVK